MKLSRNEIETCALNACSADLFYELCDQLESLPDGELFKIIDDSSGWEETEAQDDQH